MRNSEQNATCNLHFWKFQKMRENKFKMAFKYYKARDPPPDLKKVSDQLKNVTVWCNLGGDVVLDSVNMAFGYKDKILDQIYEKQINLYF